MQKQQIPTQPRPLPDGPLYFVGIGGAGMSAIAYVLAQRGHPITGSDPGISSATRARLESVGITVFAQHDPAQVGEVAALIATDAVNEQNPEVKAARERGIPVFRRPEALAAIFNAGRGIAIAGTHGKTTTTGMVASILLHAGLKPTILIGGDLPMIGGNACNGDPNAPGGDIVLAESCEAYDGFLYLHPEIAVITNIEADHLDYHGTEDAVFASFEWFACGIRMGGSLVCCADDKNIRQLLLKVDGTSGLGCHYDRDVDIWGYSIQLLPRLDDWNVREGNSADQEIVEECLCLFADNVRMDESGTRFDLCDWDFNGNGPATIKEFPITLKVPGMHNVSNALAAAAVGFNLGISKADIVAGLEAFTGTGRRFEKLGELNGVLVVDDYAHHPTEIKATLAAARSAYPDRRIIAVFQPHLPSRTRDFMEDFASALANGPGEGGLVFLTDIYLAREQAIPGVSSETLAAKVRERNALVGVHYVPDKNDLPIRLVELVQPGDLVLTMGAGDIRKAGEGLLKLLSPNG
jgi:UDP-N-acetylmuramate--alanine ligase